jgi:hypothetical protein
MQADTAAARRQADAAAPALIPTKPKFEDQVRGDSFKEAEDQALVLPPKPRTMRLDRWIEPTESATADEGSGLVLTAVGVSEESSALVLPQKPRTMRLHRWVEPGAGSSEFKDLSSSRITTMVSPLQQQAAHPVTGTNDG